MGTDLSAVPGAKTEWGGTMIFVTAHDKPSVRGEAEELGAGGYFPIPFSGRMLLDAVTQAPGCIEPH